LEERLIKSKRNRIIREHDKKIRIEKMKKENRAEAPGTEEKSNPK